MRIVLFLLAFAALLGAAYVTWFPSSLVPAPITFASLHLVVAAMAGFISRKLWPFALLWLWGVAFLTLAAGWPGGVDQHANLAMAKGLLSENTYSVSMFGTTLRALYPPAYPFLIAGWSALLSDGRLGIIVLNLIVNAAAAWTLWLLVAERWGKHAALYAAFLFMAWPDRVLFSMSASKEGLALLFVCQAMLALGRLEGGFSRKEAMRLGGATALIGLAQPAWILFPPIAALLILGPKWKIAAWATIPFLIILMPWWIRNGLVFGQFVPLTTGTAMSFHVAVTGGWEGLESYFRKGDEITAAPLMVRDSLLLIEADPIRFALYRMAMIVRAIVFDFAGTVALGSGADQSRVAQWIPACQLFYVAILVLAGIAAKRLPNYFVMAVLIMVAIFAPWVEFDLRHAVIIVPALIASASIPLARPPALRWRRLTQLIHRHRRQDVAGRNI